MTVREMQDKILQLKKEKDICILAHSYVAREIQEIADFTGDSFQLSVLAEKAPQKTVIMCGVRFMAETVKILSPEKTVYIASPIAGCPMAEQMDKELIEKIKKEDPSFSVVAYINTTASLKTVCDVCVTSSSAVKVVSNIENDNILFIPDINLGSYVAKKLPHKNIKLLDGGCPVHAGVTEAEAIQAKKAHPNALFLVHPECRPDVVKYADVVGSTKDIVDYVVNSDKNEFIRVMNELLGREVTEEFDVVVEEKYFGTFFICFFFPKFVENFEEGEKLYPQVTRVEKAIISLVGVLGLVSVPVFKSATGLPPFMGVLFVMGLLWLITEIIYKQMHDI